MLGKKVRVKKALRGKQSRLQLRNIEGSSWAIRSGKLDAIFFRFQRGVLSERECNSKDGGDEGYGGDGVAGDDDGGGDGGVARGNNGGDWGGNEFVAVVMFM